MYLPKIMVIEGNVGVGKTLTAVYLSLYHQEHFGLHIYSNVQLYKVSACECGEMHQLPFNCEKTTLSELTTPPEIFSPDYTHLQGFLGMYEIFKAAEQNEELLKDASFILDEGQRFLDSRLSTSKMNRILNAVVGDFRKYQLDIYVTCHSRTMLDKRFRRYVTHLVEPKLYEDADVCVIKATEVLSGKVLKHEFQPSLIYPFYKTEEHVRPGGKGYRVSKEDLQ